MRPTILHVGGVLYWTIQTRNPDTMVLKDADSTPSVAVRKNGSFVADSVTIAKRSATTGLYDCSYNPAAEVEGDTFQFEESAAVTGTTTSSATYVNQFSVRVRALERGTDGALQPTVAGHTLNVSVDGEGDVVLNSGALDPVLEAVADVQASIDAGGSPVFTAVVVARIATGTAAGWPEDLTIGDAYLSENAGAQPLFIKDVADNILSGLGTKLFSDPTFVATLRLAPLTDGTRALDTPPTTIEVKSTDLVGIVYNDDTAGAEYFELQIPRAKTLLGVTKTKYSCQFIMNWGDDETFERTVNLGEIRFLRKNAPAT